MSEATHDSFPDISSLQPVTDIELPTQFQISQDKLTLSGLINCQLTQEYSPIHVIEEDSIVSFTLSPQETLDQQDQQLEILLQQHEVNDIQSIMNGFGNPDSLSIMDNKDDMGGMFKEPWMEIVEQPKSNSLRFRYECEGKGAGALQGKFSTQETKTFPKIKVHGFQGFATVVVSCVTHNQDPPKAHPHNLVSPASVPNGCKFGICTQVINPETMTAEFPHLGIQCVRRKDIKRSLDLRREKKVDPYRQGWKHVENPQNIDLNAVKLCFHVWYEADVPGKCTKPMKPVCSDPIYDAKAKKELQICDISDTSSPALGDKKIIILCEKISRDDIRVRFYDEAGWEAYANFSPSEVHKQYAISFKTPKYRDLNIKEKVRVQVELCKVNGETSEPQDFYYLPTNRTTPNVSSYGEEICKQEIKLEDNSLYKSQRMQMIPRSNVGKSPYTHIQLGQQGGFVLAEKRDTGDGGGRGVLGGEGVVGGRGVVGGGGVVGVDQSSDFSLSNVQPFNLIQIISRL
ncbi:embryonic polarity protein dorsal [Eurytemora carolleeae]|uniref:embryonic polarity protein dorsal n=1 Tax=Eurytemora carolleeae TaxID=1294199 RepID=UPI000C76520C|nr:embryonic polarity protein dorsal [Eurytemora carolleeae]|eukprot:XP_023332679.1 embryonic polarity protein dorsal-like [Eurytemora affinis]